MLNFIKKYKIAIIVAAVAVTALVIAFVSGGNAGDIKEQLNKTQTTLATFDSAEKQSSPKDNIGTTAGESTSAITQPSAAESTAKTEKSTEASKAASVTKPSESKQSSAGKYLADPVPKNKPEPVEPHEQAVKENTITCTFSISCASVLDNMNKLDSDKTELIPDDGWILKPTTVTLNEGESVFDILLRVCKENKIHMEYSWTPIYNSTYIEGINNLYELDCGSASGWMYSVNDWYPNYGCSRYVPESGDTIEWRYTCNLGYDIGGGYAQQRED